VADGTDKPSRFPRRSGRSASGYPPYPPYPAYSPYPPYPPYPPPCAEEAAQRRPPPCPEVPGPCEPCGGGWEPSGGGPPGWGEPDANGWQCRNAPFTIPLTRSNWPARYDGAPDPSAADVVDLDLGEAARRLGALALGAGLSPAQQQGQLSLLRSELDRLVGNFPTTLLSDVPINAPSSANAPTLGLTLVQQLLLLAADPYFARVLGLYFVDTDIEDGVAYDYCVVGDWGATQTAVDRITPGLAPDTAGSRCSLRPTPRSGAGRATMRAASPAPWSIRRRR
jgi:hypothetical protein